MPKTSFDYNYYRNNYRPSRPLFSGFFIEFWRNSSWSCLRSYRWSQEAPEFRAGVSTMAASALWYSSYTALATHPYLAVTGLVAGLAITILARRQLLQLPASFNSLPYHRKACVLVPALLLTLPTTIYEAAAGRVIGPAKCLLDLACVIGLAAMWIPSVRQEEEQERKVKEELMRERDAWKSAFFLAFSHMHRSERNRQSTASPRSEASGLLPRISAQGPIVEEVE